MIDAFKSIEKLCRLYGTNFYIHVSDCSIGLYNVQDDDFHIFTWSDNRYVLSDIQDYIPNWIANKVGI